MSDKNASKRITFRADDGLEGGFREYCRFHDLRPSQVMRKALKEYAPLRPFLPKSFFQKRRAV